MSAGSAESWSPALRTPSAEGPDGSRVVGGRARGVVAAVLLHRLHTADRELRIEEPREDTDDRVRGVGVDHEHSAMDSDVKTVVIDLHAAQLLRRSDRTSLRSPSAATALLEWHGEPGRRTGCAGRAGIRASAGTADALNGRELFRAHGSLLPLLVPRCPSDFCTRGPRHPCGSDRLSRLARGSPLGHRSGSALSTAWSGESQSCQSLGLDSPGFSMPHGGTRSVVWQRRE